MAGRARGSAGPRSGFATVRAAPEERALGLEPYAGTFGHAEAAHLCRRAGFGAAPAERDALVAVGLPAAVDMLFPADEGGEAHRWLTRGALMAESEDLPALQAVWLQRMLTTRAPGREKLTLFLHGHFATSHAKVQSTGLMWRQYRLLREHAAGPFADLVRAISRDPAMILWLDGNRNQRRHPNENYARELLELFTLGVGHYTEDDVREVARAFTGWHCRNGAFWFDAAAHDDGTKHVLGRAVESGDEVIAVIVQQPACAHFLAEKLLCFYVEPEPSPALTLAFAACLKERDGNLAAALRRLFGSQAFFAPAVRRSLIKSPIDLCVGALRSLPRRVDSGALAGIVGRMGQSLFAPPSVKGWRGHRAWLDSQTYVTRQRFATALAFGTPPFLGEAPAWMRSSKVTLEDCLEQLDPGGLGGDSRQVLGEFEASAARGDGDPAAAAELAQLVLSSPEYQLL